jgi:hypothetical protein
MSDQTQNEILRTLGQVEGKVDAIDARMNDFMVVLNDHTRDLDHMKRNESYRKGAESQAKKTSASISALTSVAVTVIIAVLNWFFKSR